MKCHNARFTPSGCKDKGLGNLSLWLRLESFVLNVNKKLKIKDVFYLFAWVQREMEMIHDRPEATSTSPQSQL